MQDKHIILIVCSCAALVFAGGLIALERTKSEASPTSVSDTTAGTSVPAKKGSTDERNGHHKDVASQRAESERKADEERWLGQQRQNETEKREREAKARLASLPIDTSWQRLPEGFCGHDSQALYAELSKRIGQNGTKDRFETDAQYQTRIDVALAGPLLGSLTSKSLYAFMVKALALYNPAKGSFDCFFEGTPVELRLLDVQESPSYIGQNAFGATREIRVMSSENLRLSPINANGITTIQFRMAGEEARKANDHLMLLLIGRIQYPYLQDHQTGTSPTIDRPQEWTKTYHDIPFALQEIWVVRDDTGEVLKKWRP